MYVSGGFAEIAPERCTVLTSARAMLDLAQAA
jgi:F0F1-type ATP synthase epsilon subunit